MLAAALLLFAQDLVPVPDRPPLGPADARGWRLVDAVLVIVDEQILTRAELLRDVAQFQGRGGPTTEKELLELQRYIVRERIRQKVQVQAGQDMGIDPKVIEQSLTNIFRRQIEEAGGTAELAERFRERNSGSLEMREALREDLLAGTWRRTVTGEEAGPGGRFRRDRYIRPGMRLFLHRRLLESPEQWSAIGGRSEEVAFRELLVPIEPGRDEAQARKRATDLRQAVVEGADFARLAEEHGMRRPDQGREQVPVAVLASIEEDDPVLTRFLRAAQPGELSEVYRAGSRRARAFGFALFLERLPPSEPDFATLGVQLALEERGRESRDAWNREQAMQRLIESAFVWPPELDPRRVESSPDEAQRLESGR